MADETAHVRELYRRIHAVIRRIPKGSVATYGQIAELAGIPGGARIAAAALKTSKPGDRLPWQRVIGKAGKTRGRIAIQDPVGAAIQRQLLEREGISLDDRGFVSLGTYGWLPPTTSGRSPKPVVRSPLRVGSARGASPRRRPRSGSTRRASSSRR